MIQRLSVLPNPDANGFPCVAPARPVRAIPKEAGQAADDAQLIAAYLDGTDPTAIEQLLKRYTWLIQTAIRRYHLATEDEADVFQDVCLTLWRELPNLRDRARIRSWLMTVASRHAWDARVRLGRETLDPHVADEDDELLPLLERIADDAPGPEESFARDETVKRVREAINRLPPRSRKLILALTFEKDQSYAEVAARLGYSMNSIGPLRGRCFRELRQLLQDFQEP